MKKITAIVEFPKGCFIESVVTQRKCGGTNWASDRRFVGNISARLMQASISNEKNLYLIDYEHCVDCMKKTLSGNSIKELIAASSSIEVFIDKIKHDDAFV